MQKSIAIRLLENSPVWKTCFLMPCRIFLFKIYSYPPFLMDLLLIRPCLVHGVVRCRCLATEGGTAVPVFVVTLLEVKLGSSSYLLDGNL